MNTPSSSRKYTKTVKSVGSLSLTIDVETPSDFDPENGVTLVHFHGGFLVVGEKQTFPPNWLIQACRVRGWAYASPAYRLLPEASGLDILFDAVDAVKWAHDNISKRIIVAGSSAGGYLALAATASNRFPRPIAMLSIYGLHDMTSDSYLTPNSSILGPVDDLENAITELKEAVASEKPIDGYPFPKNPITDQRFRWLRAIHEKALYSDLLTRQEGLAKRILNSGAEVIPQSVQVLFPTKFGLTQDLPPVALIHGNADVFVDISQSRSLAGKLRDIGVEVHFEEVDGAGHGFDVKELPSNVDIDDDHQRERNELRYDSFRRVLAFLTNAVENGRCKS